MIAMEPLLVLLVAAWVGSVGLILFVYRREAIRAWREPTLRAPVLIIESDDWGPGPDDDAAWLYRIADVLGRYQDRRGRRPVMTIGVVLALPDAATPEARPRSPAITLAADRFRAVREGLLTGVDSGSLVLQLHGLEHYWWPALSSAAGTDSAVARWLRGEGVMRTEALPPHLQTRWADTSRLPSIALHSDEIGDAVREELSTFAEVFGRPAIVAVPPTFVWDERVEREWARGGIRFIVTPGRRYVGRDSAGRLVADKEAIHNGEHGESGIVYLVRDRYFEPALGHDASRALAALADKTCAGRPTLLEMHRFNFTGDTAAALKAVSELDDLIAHALREYPEVRFLSTEELGEKIAAGDPDLIDARLVRRTATWLVRLAELSRLRKLAWLTGLAIVAWLFVLVARQGARSSSIVTARAAFRCATTPHSGGPTRAG